MKVAIYARESSDDIKKAPSIQDQIKIGKQWSEENNHQLVLVFQDNGFSGGNWKRPDWNKAVREAKRHAYQLLWVWNQDRIARDTEQFLWFFRNLKDAHVKIFSHTEGNMEMDDVGGTAKHISLAMASEIFRKVTSEKVKRTYEAKKKLAEKKGEKVNWGRKRGKYDIEKIMRLRDSGKGYKSISKEIGCSFQTIRRLLLQNTPTNLKKENIEKQGVSK